MKNMKKSGIKNVVAIKQAVKNIEVLTDRFKRKRLSQDEYILKVNQNLSNMSDERDYIEYLVNIGQY